LKSHIKQKQEMANLIRQKLPQVRSTYRTKDEVSKAERLPLKIGTSRKHERRKNHQKSKQVKEKA